MTILELTYKAIRERDWESMDMLLSRMNVLDFRKVQTELRTKILPQLENDHFWEAYLHLLKFRKQAFLACIMSVERLAKEKKVNFDNDYLKQIYLYLQSEYPGAVESILKLCIPVLTDEVQITGLFDAYSVNDRTRIACLLKMDTAIAYYALFKALKMVQDDKILIRKCCLYIMKKNDDLSLNMACVMKEYFGIDNVSCPQALKIQPFEIGYIDRNSETFMDVIQGKRPKI